LGLQIALSLLFSQIRDGGIAAPRTSADLFAKLMAIQILSSMCWSAVDWLFWQNGNPVNNIFVTLVMVSTVWSATFTRAPDRAIFIAGTLTVVVLHVLLFVLSKGTVAHVFAVIIPLWFVYMLAMGNAGRGRVEALLDSRFANEDMSAELRLARDEALRKRFEAEAANASKTAFLANMSHELRTPLNAILGFSQIIAEQLFGTVGGRYSEYARDIHSSGSHLLSLINDILDVAKIESGKMEIDVQPLDPVFAMSDVERLTSSLARARRHSVRYGVEPGLPMLLADERAFKQIAINLVSNAIKFTPEGGVIAVECRAAPEGGVLLEVSDNGPGIEAGKLARVFQAFSQIDNRYDRQAGGSGLGLALVKGMAELHGGRAWIESAQGHGTKVAVYFPLVVETPANAAVANF
jgi:two-component system cell cycle sensor histidine kinase PleC